MLKPLVDKFICSSEKLRMILNNQKAIYDKTEICYNSNKKQKFLKNLYTHSTSSYSSSNITCFCCSKLGHKAYACNSRQINENLVKKVWVPKGTINANPKRTQEDFVT